MFQRLKKPAQRATWSRFKAQAEYLAEVDALGDTGAWLAGVAPAKVTDFAGEAAAQDIDTLSRYDPVKRLALVACLVHTARMRARDDLAEMLCKRVAANVKRARAELEEIRLRQRAVSERLIGTYRTVLEHLDPGGEQAGGRAPGEAEAAAVAAVERAGGFAAQLADIEEVSAFHGDNYEVLVHRFFRKDRAVMFELAGRLDLVATTSDDSVLAVPGQRRVARVLRGSCGHGRLRLGLRAITAGRVHMAGDRLMVQGPYMVGAAQGAEQFVGQLGDRRVVFGEIYGRHGHTSWNGHMRGGWPPPFQGPETSRPHVV